MKSVELYLRVRRAVFVEGRSRREAARHFGIARKTVEKMCSFSAPPGYRRSTAPARPKLEEPIPVPPPRPMLDPVALEAFLRTCRPSVTVLSIEGLDGYLAALLIGPKFIDPRLWMARLFGEAALLADADTQEHLAIQAVAHHHNRLSALQADPYCGSVFIFRSKRMDRLKLLVWDGTGIILATKWLEDGRFFWPPVRDGAIQLSAAQFALLIDGLDWTKAAARTVRRPSRVG